MTPQTDRQDFIVIPAAHHTMEEGRTSSPRSSSPSAILIILTCLIIPIALVCGMVMDNEMQTLGAVLALIGMLVIVARPFYGLIFFTALLYIRPEENIPQLASMHLTLAVAVVTLLGMWFQMALKKEPFVRTPLNFMIIGFGIVAIISGLQDNNLNGGVQDISRLVLLVLLILNLVRTPAQYRALVTAVLVFTAYLAIHSIHLYYIGDALFENGTRERAEATGIFGDPNDLAATLVAGLALAAIRVPTATKIMKGVYILLSAVMIWGIFVTDSRGGMLALMAVLFGYFITIVKNKKIAVVLGVIAAMAALMSGSGHMTNFDAEEQSAHNRFSFWQTGYYALLDRPLLGVGYDGFESVNGGRTAHNSFVLCYAETGIIGYFFWIGCLYYCYRRPEQDTKGPHAQAPPALSKSTMADVLGARLALTGYLVASFWLSHTYTSDLYLLISLPAVAQLVVSQQAAPARPGMPAPPQPSQLPRWIDVKRIAWICLGSIVFIQMMARYYLAQ